MTKRWPQFAISGYLWTGRAKVGVAMKGDFLVVYNRRTGRSTITGFADWLEAIKARVVAESDHAGEPNVEVLVLSGSEKALRVTHPRYFDNHPDPVSLS
jgi:hypothetical protein